MCACTIVLGAIGLSASEAYRAHWNAFFRQKNVDAFFDFYPTDTTDLAVRLSEMFHFQRRGYILSSPLQSIILPLLDHMDQTAMIAGKADTVVNRSGVLSGHYYGDLAISLCMQRRFQLWFPSR